MILLLVDELVIVDLLPGLVSDADVLHHGVSIFVNPLAGGTEVPHPRRVVQVDKVALESALVAELLPAKRAHNAGSSRNGMGVEEADEVAICRTVANRLKFVSLEAPNCVLLTRI